MNVENMRRVRDFIDDSDTFNMSIYTYCRTPGCIAGHAAALVGHIVDIQDNMHVSYTAAKFLGLDTRYGGEADQLFCGHLPAFRLRTDPMYAKSNVLKHLDACIEAGCILPWKLYE